MDCSASHSQSLSVACYGLCMEKRCPKCSRTLPPSEFGPDPKARDGLTGWCLPCHRVVVNAGYRKQRQRAVASLGGRCVRCAYDVDDRALQLDHINSDGATVRATCSPNTILRSVLNDDGTCYQLLCANCNAIKRIEYDERGKRVYTRIPLVAGTRVSKRCPRCNVVKPSTEFHRNAARSDGLASCCAICLTTARNAAYQQLRLRVIEHLGGSCKHCGYDADCRALTLDHVNSDGGVDRKSGLVHRAALVAVLADEQNKYQLLCMNCNIIKKFEQREYGSRIYVRAVPLERIDRPDHRHSEEWKQHCSEISRRNWASNTEYRERMSKVRSENMKRRWASGEVPNRPKSS